MMKREREKEERAGNDAATPTLTPQACNSHHSLPSIFHGDKQDWKQERLASPLLPVFLDSFSRPCRRFLLVCSTMHSHFRKKPSPVPWANCNLIAVEVWRNKVCISFMYTTFCFITDLRWISLSHSFFALLSLVWLHGCQNSTTMLLGIYSVQSIVVYMANNVYNAKPTSYRGSVILGLSSFHGVLVGFGMCKIVRLQQSRCRTHPS